jgi:dsDNA-specific endonuclease/ATPase MutS2
MMHHQTMVWDFLMRAFRGAPARAGRVEDSLAPDQSDEDPFPDPVVIEFRDVIDLHSIPPRQVKAVVEEYLEEARRRGTRWVRIIHGKGRGVQRESVRAILSRTPYVAEFRDAPPEAGGWGATLVTLASPDLPDRI